MSLTAQVIEELVNAGVTGDALVRVVKAIEQASLSDAHVRTASVTPGALRMRKLRETKALEREQAVTPCAQPEKPTYSNNNTSLSEIDSSKERDMSESVTKASRRGARRCIDYTDTFKTFWLAYPSDPGMSKADAFMEFQKFDADDQAKACKSLPAFKAWIPKQGKDYRTIHACNYLKQRRFDGFVEEAMAQETAQEQHSTQVYVQYGTDAGDAWERYYRTVLKKPPPRDNKGGWRFPTEYPEPERKTA
jgi:hypothetical protein